MTATGCNEVTEATGVLQGTYDYKFMYTYNTAGYPLTESQNRDGEVFENTFTLT